MKRLYVYLLMSLLVVVSGVSYLRIRDNLYQPVTQPLVNSQVLSVQQTGYENFSILEVSKHDSANDCWLIVEDSIYNMTNFMKKHPGGSRVITGLCGKDGTNTFKNRGELGSHPKSAGETLMDYFVGKVSTTL